ncbi:MULTISPECIES: hypothetical protein [unclassified Microcoleus]|uniref:hypothetical protein n=1 Tax=unclassified Microcoleus TaxID=2642155 RepID=UPI001E0FB826|nr:MULTISPECIES: hypothetical protein [unclassified Microcoleus]MCC3444953.1 hypothetical protein [Microcoleus sp. PH2017_03_ELD_O_A]MCC3507356.1 hypothetical protein [Microcoleus sp. PH2017_19_SFW_U_A]MCC3512630.1 hypothetical protein [Microcoleus sp. PH2017_17_BER_D_A]MCC3526319.1 hypothetical protein [Microcoleus sp. PH2017_20_SFW_D_A]MCC3550644.1 hypothetical protein [Microcoleus sp. PH2017_24_DOB_U_A]MCC3629858.1 hypothetical protein [Microcoleus sp. PH2017_39_LGB_O_B]
MPNRPPHGEVSLLWRALNLAKPQLPPYPQPLPMGNKLSLYGSCQGDTRNRTCSLRAIIQQTLSCFAFKLGFLSAETASLAEIARSI